MNKFKPKSICIIGAGALGLSAAYYLSRSNQKENDISVTIIEASSKLGGLAGSHTLANGELIESYYHHVFKTDKYFSGICRELGIYNKIRFSPATVGHYYERKLYKVGGVMDILFGSLLSTPSRLRFLVSSLYLKIGVEKRFKDICALDGSRRLYGNEATKKIWLPLLEGKFNQSYQEVPMSWLASRIRDRSIKLGYYNDGFHQFYDKLAETCVSQGVAIHYNTKVITATEQSDLVEINGRLYDACLSTVGPVVEKSFGIFDKTINVHYLGAICVIYELDANPGIPYWTNFCDPESPVLAVINHRELERSNRFGDIFPVYAAAYLEPGHKLFNAHDNDIAKLFYEPVARVAQACKVNSLPKYRRATVYRARYAQPLINPDIGLVPIADFTGPAYRASMHSIYPNDRGQNYAIELGRKMALKIIRDLA